jgi:hypothetical protein
MSVGMKGRHHNVLELTTVTSSRTQVKRSAMKTHCSGRWTCGSGGEEKKKKKKKKGEK